MSKISEMTRESWIKATFPEWGTWLVEDIENEVVPEGQVAMWWLGCTGIWFKTPGGANITIDLWCGNGKRTHGNGKMAVGHQMANMCGGRAMQPNLRNVPLLTVLYADNVCDNLDAYTLTYSMTELRYVSLENCGITSMNWLYKFNNLVYVDLAENNISDVDFEGHISNASIKTLKELYLDTNVPCSFTNAYREMDFNVEKLSLEGISLEKMEYMPYLDNVRYLNLSRTGLPNLTGADPELEELYDTEKADALDDYRRKQGSAAAISALLSAKRDEVAPAVERLMEAQDKLKERASALGMRYAALRAASIAPTEGHICLFEEGMSEAAARELVNRLAEKTPGAAALFLAEGELWRYVIGSRSLDLRARAREINAGVAGRGGGRPEMIQGSASASAEEIEAFFKGWIV